MDISTEIAAIQAASEGSELRQPIVDALTTLNSGTLPAVTASDAGKILKVGANGWEVGEKSGYMPVPSASLSVSENGTYDVTNYASTVVNVPQTSVTQADNGKVVSNGVLVEQSAHAEIIQNGTYDTTLNNEVTVNISGGGSGGNSYFSDRITPLHFDVIGGYYSAGTWNVGDNSTRTDVYDLDTNKRYIATLGSSAGNRFRIGSFSTDVSEATSSVHNGQQIYANDTPSAYNSVIFTPSNRYVVIGKTNQSVSGLQTYVMEVKY